MSGNRRGRLGWWALALLPGLLPATTLAQSSPAPAPPSERSASRPAVAPLLPAGHWVLPVLARLDGLGQLPARYDPSSTAWTADEALAALRAAAAVDGGSRLADGAADALAAEVEGTDRAATGRPGAIPAAGRLPSWVAAAHVGREGGLMAGYDTAAGTPPVAPSAAADASVPAIAGRLAGRAGGWLAAELTPVVDADGVRLRDGHVVVRLPGPVGVWAGRREMGLGQHAGSPGLLVGAPYRLDGLGAALLPGRRLPGPLTWLGPVAMETAVGPAERAGATASPWFWAFQGSVRPHARLRLGLERAALIGGAGNVPVGVREVLETLIGSHGRNSAVNNQALALSAWYRPPFGPLPVVLYGAWAMDDGAGAWWDVPARRIGLELAAIPGWPAAALSLERVAFAESCCGNPAWYRHLQLPWLHGRRPLGHPLAGHGREWRLRARLDEPVAGLNASLETFLRERGHENLLAPDRAGTSRGAELRLRFRPPGWRVELSSALAIDAGETGWRDRQSRVAARVWW